MTATPLLDRYRDAGYTISREGDGVRVKSEHPMPENTRARLSERKLALLRELAYEAAGLEEWRAPLALGHLVVCANCDAFQFGVDPAGLGHCLRYDTESAPFVPFACEDFLPSATPAAPGFLPDPMVGDEGHVGNLMSPRRLAALRAQAEAMRRQGDELRAEVGLILATHTHTGRKLKAFAVLSYLHRNPQPSLRRVQEVIQELRTNNGSAPDHLEQAASHSV